ncbi:hypothetical protein DPMN_100118, partial [Dreissena polymorpha]
MDANKLIDVLRATLDPNQREEAEKQLEIVHKIIGFAPILLQVVMEESIDMPVRQAGVVYLKNMCTQFWRDREAENPSDPVPFNIHEQDRLTIRNNIIEAVIHAPEPIRVQLCVCISTVIKNDYPGRWPDFPKKVAFYIQSDNHSTWMGALMSLYQMVKVYEYKRSEERQILDDAMVHILPVCYQRCLQLLPDPSEHSVLLQKQILKIFYAYIQNHLPLEAVSKETFTHWMELIRQIIDRPVPEQTNQVDIDDRPELPWWKTKKWAVHILSRTFERYGSPGNVHKDYNQFAEWYLKAFSGGAIQVLFKVLDEYRRKMYVAPRVMQQALNFLNQGVSHAFSWKFMKPHIQPIIQEVIFPLMCHSDSDEELWDSDPQEYIRLKYDVFEDFLSPVIAAQTLFYSCASKRKEVLQKSMGFCMQLLTSGTTETRQKDGAMHMIGAVAEVLLKRKIYKDQAEMMLVSHVYPEFTSPNGFLRARACWVMRVFSEMRFKQEAHLYQALEHSKNCMCTDKELPVRVEAAIALQMLISDQEKAKQYMTPHVRTVILELLKIIRETENDDLTGTMQRLVCTYVEEVTPIAVEMMSHLATTFSQVLETDSDGSEEKAITALGILNTMETIVTVMEEQKEIMLQLEGIVLNVVGVILQQNIIDFYEEVLSLIYSLTSSHVTVHMWQVFGMLYEMFQKDGVDYFTDMMPALHNYITVDTRTFLSNSSHLEAIYNMCKQVMSADVGEDAECHAAKLLEVILLQCPGQVDTIVRPFVELVLERLTREVETSELRTMCLQVVIAALYYNTPLLIETLKSVQIANVQGSVMEQFLKQWIHDADCFLGLHDRKISVLGLCNLLSMMESSRPSEVTELGPELLPATLVLFGGLRRAYETRAENETSDSDDDGDEDADYEQDALASDEDEIDEEGQQYLEKLEKT